MKLQYFVLAAVLALAVFAGCSDDQGVNPTDHVYKNRGVGQASVSIGPSEIVLCIDVSDSISTDELDAIVNSLSGCLSDPSLIPQDGMIYLGGLVYGDTVAQFLKPATPVTAQNLEEVILPALKGLLTDRLVGGKGADLAEALAMSGTILGSSAVNDRQVLIVGSGVATEPKAVETACAALGSASVMVSALEVNADKAGAALLKGCADATGGFFGELCSDAFAYMLQVDIAVKPEDSELKRGVDFTATAFVFRGGDVDEYPVVGHDVKISVVEGPNVSESITAATDTNGVVTLTYNGDGGPGTDTVLAATLHPNTGTTLTDTAYVEWLNLPPTCDAGGPYDVTVTTDTAKVTLDASASDDADGDSLSYTWSVKCENGVMLDDPHAVDPVLMITGDCLCVDSIMVDLVVSDGFDETSCETMVHIEDMRPPIVELRTEPVRLWPPNHRHHTVTPASFIVSATDACGRPIDIAANVKVMKVTSDEPEDSKGDGRTVNDIMVSCPNTVQLRAERQGGEMGRVYTIFYRVVGENGVGTDIEARVVVPHDSSGREVVENVGGGYTFTPSCGDGNIRHNLLR